MQSPKFVPVLLKPQVPEVRSYAPRRSRASSTSFREKPATVVLRGARTCTRTCAAATAAGRAPPILCRFTREPLPSLPSSLGTSSSASPPFAVAGTRSAGSEDRSSDVRELQTLASSVRFIT
ncbi:hypothetical protein Vretimale_4700 [Volvox reticuliferus]|uniref:Uncharacterized protein n=1 Tax=Volvox reticuliferus TaxID=1737510 RepID=A0A8J4G522_9CHLO|nr:hypothetical protein Vretifemale_3302 [Volvox reticuliferus]GIL99561.1 hypothetical protein Vretimale_4700 [Volvox reticuliferus]